MLRQLGGMLIEAPAMDGFQLAGDLLMQSNPAWRDDLVVEGLTKKKRV
jgi:hypothetical protein